MKKTYKISGMECSSCATLIEVELEDQGIKSKCSYAKETLEVEDNDKVQEQKIKLLVKNLGYELNSTSISG
jgi:copper chaperone CopZ